MPKEDKRVVQLPFPHEEPSEAATVRRGGTGLLIHPSRTVEGKDAVEQRRTLVFVLRIYYTARNEFFLLGSGRRKSSEVANFFLAASPVFYRAKEKV